MEAIDVSADPSGYERAARALLQKAETERPADAPLHALIRTWIAAGLGGQGKIDPAIALMEESLPLAESWASDAGHGGYLAESLSNYGLLLYLKGEFERARPPIERAVGLLRADPASDRENLMSTLDAYSNALWQTGERDRAMEINAEAIALGQTIDPTPGNLATVYGNAVFFRRGMGDVTGAIAAGRDGLAFLERRLPADHPNLATIYANMGVLLRSQGRPRASFPMLRRAFETIEKAQGENQTSAFMRAMAATSLAASGQTEAAIAFTEAALPILDAQLGREAERTRRARTLYVQLLGQAGRGAEALPLARELVAIADATLPAMHQGRIETRIALARTAEVTGDVGLADGTMADAVELQAAIAPRSHPDLVSARAYALFLRSRVLPQEGRIRLTGQALDLLDLLEANANRDPGAPLTEDQRASFGYLARVLLDAGEDDAAWRAQQWSARNSVDDAAAAAILRRFAADESLSEALAARRAVLVERQALLAGMAEALAAEGSGLAGIEQDLAALDSRLAEVDAQMAAAGLDAARFTPVSRAEVSARLADKAAFMQLTEVPGGTLVAAMTGDRHWLYLVDDAAGGDLEAAVAQVRRSLDPARPDTPFATGASAALFARLFPRSVADAVMNAETLFVSANGALGALPFAVLVPDAAKDAFLVDTVAIGRLPGPPRVAAGDAMTPAAILFGMGAIGGSGAVDAMPEAMPEIMRGGDGGLLVDLPPLPNAAGELAALASGFAADRQTILLGADATERALAEARIAPGSVLAFATHGLVSGEVEGLREPALLLHRDDADDGLLTASEIAVLDLPAQWVILSACNTAAAAGPDAAGLSGLAQAFITAGAANVLATHWPVRDDIAAAISVATLREAAGGLAPAQALRAAMLAVRGDARIEGAAHPAMWAPFEVVGY